MAILVGGACNSSTVLPLQPTLKWQFLIRGLILKRLPIAAHCSSILHGNFSHGCYSSSILPLQPIGAHSSWQFYSRRGDFPKLLPLQPIAFHSYIAILDRGLVLKNPAISADCSPLLHGNFSQGVVIPRKSFHCSPF